MLISKMINPNGVAKLFSSKGYAAIMIPVVQRRRLMIVLIFTACLSHNDVMMLIITGFVPTDKEPSPAETFCMAIT